MDDTQKTLRAILKFPLDNPWIVDGAAIRSANDATPLIKDPSVSPENLQEICNALNFYIRSLAIERLAEGTLKP